MPAGPGARYLAQCYASATDPAEIDRSAIPREFVAKPSHASGGVWIVSDEAPAEMKIVAAPDARGPLWTGSGWNDVLVRPEALDWDLFVKTSGHLSRATTRAATTSSGAN